MNGLISGRSFSVGENSRWLLSYNELFLCVWLSVSVSVFLCLRLVLGGYVCMCMCICVHSHMEAKGQPWESFLKNCLPYFFEAGTLTGTWGSRLGWMADEPWGSTCLFVSSTWIINRYHYVYLLMYTLGLKLSLHTFMAGNLQTFTSSALSSCFLSVS